MKTLLQVKQVKVHFGDIKAVDGVDLVVHEGESVGLVGESGCGKTTLGRTILRLEKPTDGEVYFDEAKVTSLRGRALKNFRKRAQMIFQDPYSSLNPRMTVGNALDEVLFVHRLGSKSERKNRAAELLTAVGLDPVYLSRYPHEFSGGQRQRIGIARALAVNPELVIADEPVSALDVSVQVQILNLLKDLQEKFKLSYLFVAHDLAVVRYLCKRVMVMYLGKIVESGPAEELYKKPMHPYTVALLAAVPDVEKGLKHRNEPPKNATIKGDVSVVHRVVQGCPFHPRCPMARDKCRVDAPPLREVAPGRLSACHFAEEVKRNAE